MYNTSGSRLPYRWVRFDNHSHLMVVRILRTSAMANGRRSVSTLILCSLTLVLVPALGLSRQLAPSDQDEVIQRFHAAQADMQGGRFDRAVEQFKKVLQLQPGLVEARVDLGLAYHALGDYSLAVSELSQAAKQRPDLLAANLFLGISYLKMGSAEKAIAPLDRALQIDPSNREGRRALGTAELSECRRACKNVEI